MKKRGQLTIFIIVGILLVASVSLFFLSRAGFIPQLLGGKPETSANVFLDSCLEEEIDEAIKIISLQGGYISNPLNKTFTFTDEGVANDISYLCYNQGIGFCINQELVLLKHLEDEIKNYIEEDVENCFIEMIDSFNRQRFEVGVGPNSGLNSFEVELNSKEVIVQTDSKVTLTKSGESSTQKNFRVSVNTRLYELANVVQEIVNKEATKCDFDHFGYMGLYKEFTIDKPTKLPDSTQIYRIEYKDTGEKFRFAVRGCVAS